MSGTRKMGKFDASGGTRKTGKLFPDGVPADELLDAEDAAPELATRPSSLRTPDGFAELSTRPFEPRAGAGSEPPAAATTSDASGYEPGEWIPPQSDGAVSSEGPEAFRTHLTRKFVDLADSVTADFTEFAIGAGAWAVELTAPQGMSTGGGKQALQHLRMRPRRNGYAVLVVGTVNQVEKRAELRDFDHVSILHEVRYRKPLELSSAEWEQFLRKAEVVLNRVGIQSMRTPPPHELLDQRRSMQRISKRAVVTLVVVLSLAAIVLFRVAVTLLAR